MSTQIAAPTGPAAGTDDGLQPAWPALATALLERELVRHAGQDTAGAEKALAAAERAYADALRAESPFADIVASAELGRTEARVLAVCGSVALDRRLQRVVATLTADPTNDRLDVDLLARLLGRDAVAALTPQGRLVSAGLLELDDGVSLAAARIGVPRTVAWALAGELALDPALPPGAEVVVAPDGALGGPRLLLVHGSDRVRRVQAAVSATWGVAFLLTPPPADDDGWRVLLRQATVAGLGVVLELSEPPTGLARRHLEAADHLSWALASAHPLPLEELPDLEFAEIEAADQGVGDAEWTAVYPDAPLPARRPTATQLQLVQKVALPGGVPALRRLASGALLKHARRIEPHVTWDDLVLPRSQERRLRELVDRYRHRRQVHEDWGLPLFPSPGVVALFSGPSGTGKTTSAEVMAHDLGVDLFRVDLSALVSKYIGETEKNLEEIFSAAHAGDYLLLFDEADSLFGQRSAVSDARDRYANMEVSYLLQRLETYDGFVVLTSNFQGNIDDAFLRRIHATVHFPMPTPEDRARIWTKALARAPLADDVDLDHLSSAFEIAGGNIRNAALTAAFLAAGAGAPVGMTELLQACAQELTKLRQRVTDAHLGRWAGEVAARS